MLQLLDDVAVHASADTEATPEKILRSFYFLLGSQYSSNPRSRLLEAAVDVLDEGTIMAFKTIDSKRIMWRVKSSKDREYTVHILIKLFSLYYFIC